MAGITFQDITKRYPDGFEAVKDLSLDVPDGQLMILVGPSGCGKSTTLRMVAGLEDISAGELLIDGVSSSTTRQKIATSRWCFRTMRCIRTCPCTKTWVSH